MALCEDKREIATLDRPATRRETLEQAFGRMQENSGRDVSRNMLWGYFFTNDQRGPMELAATELSQLGYRVVDTYLSDKDDPSEADLWWLHVERVEIHSVDSLLVRNDELETFAEKLGLASYDGWDVGPASGDGE